MTTFPDHIKSWTFLGEDSVYL